MLMISELPANTGDHISLIFQKWPGFYQFSFILQAFIEHLLNVSHCLGTKEGRQQGKRRPLNPLVGQIWGVCRFLPLGNSLSNGGDTSK